MPSHPRAPLEKSTNEELGAAIAKPPASDNVNAIIALFKVMSLPFYQTVREIALTPHPLFRRLAVGRTPGSEHIRINVFLSGCEADSVFGDLYCQSLHETIL
jgi:hypothetical protein